MKRPIRVLVIAGGKSEEHEVSISSARSVLAAMKDSGYEVTPLMVSKEGLWLSLPESQQALGDGAAPMGGALVLSQAQIAHQYDVVFPLIHGPNGEDGRLQGLLELAQIPYVGAGVLGSALCMDKPMAKDVLKSHGIPQVDYRVVTRADVDKHWDKVLTECQQIGPPWFVKPANLGSSVGIRPARRLEELRDAVDHALSFDRRVIVERSIPHRRELEVGILGNDDIAASPVGEITYDAEFYDYETKYTDGRAALHIPAQIPKRLANNIQGLAMTAYRAVDCAGFARVDFFYDTAAEKLYLNELNTIPGFTPTSMFTKLWMSTGMTYADVITRLVELALERGQAGR